MSLNKSNKIKKDLNIDPLIKLSDVCKITGYSRSSIYRLMGLKQLPPCIHLSPGATRWRLSSIINWVTEKEKTSQNIGDHL